MPMRGTRGSLVTAVAAAHVCPLGPTGMPLELSGSPGRSWQSVAPPGAAAPEPGSLAAEVSWLATESATLRQMLLELTERLVANEERTAQLLQHYRDELGVDGTPLDDESPATSMRAV